MQPPQMTHQVCILREAVAKMLSNSIKTVVCLLAKVKDDPHVVTGTYQHTHYWEINSKKIHASAGFGFIVKFRFIVLCEM